MIGVTYCQSRPVYFSSENYLLQEEIFLLFDINSFLCPGSVPTGTDAEAEEETEASEKGVAEKASQKTEIHNIEDNPDSALPTTPLRLSRFDKLIVCRL